MSSDVPSGLETLAAGEEATAVLPPEKKRVLAGRYELTARIGEGGFGNVHRAYDRNLRRVVAVKVLKSEIAQSEVVRRFEREAIVLARLDAPEIVPIYDYGIDEGEFFIVMQFIEGESLSSVLAARRVLSVRESVDIATAVCRALAVAHSNRVVHRDLKPSNIMLPAAGGVRLVDFGISKQLDAAGATGSMVVGTPMYMSPEQANGLDLDERSDIFSLGCVLFEMLTGERPFKGKTLTDYLASVVYKQPETARLVERDVPDPIIAVVSRSLEKDPARRYATASEMLQALEAAAGLDKQEAPATAVRFADVAWPLAATAAVLALFTLLTPNQTSLGIALFVSAVPLLWIGRKYWKYLDWQYAALLFSLPVGSIIFLSTVSVWAPGYAAIGAVLPSPVRAFIYVMGVVGRYFVVALWIGAAIAGPLLRKYGYAVVKTLNSAPARFAAFALAALFMGLVGYLFRLTAQDYFVRVRYRNVSDRELRAAYAAAVRIPPGWPYSDASPESGVDPRLRFGKLLIESGLPIQRDAPIEQRESLNRMAGLFEAIPAVPAGESLEARWAAIYRWWAEKLAPVPHAAAARRTALNRALSFAPGDPELKRLLGEVEFEAGNYVAAIAAMEAEALRTTDVVKAQRVVSLLAANGRCADASSFARDFGGALMLAKGSERKALPDLLAPCREGR